MNLRAVKGDQKLRRNCGVLDSTADVLFVLPFLEFFLLVALGFWTVL